MHSLKYLLIGSIAALPFFATETQARPRLGGAAIVGVAAGVALGVMGARRLRAHPAPRHRHVRQHRARDRAAYAVAPAAAATGAVATGAVATERAQNARAPAGTQLNSQMNAQMTWAGPLFWPYAYDDVMNYAFLRDGDTRFWSFGHGDIVAALFAPPNAPDLSRTYLAASASAARADAAKPSLMVPNPCLSTRGYDWPIKWIEQTVRPTEAQQAAFTDLKSAFYSAADYIRSACPTMPTAEQIAAMRNATPEQKAQAAEHEAAIKKMVETPPDRFDTMKSRIWALRQAVTALRAPMAAFYDTLSDEQRAKLNRGSATGVAAACANEAEGATVEKLSQVVQPTDAQRGGLETLMGTSTYMREFLKGSCPKDTPATPVARLDTAVERLLAMEYAVASLSSAVVGFYGSLDGAQKVNLNVSKK